MLHHKTIYFNVIDIKDRLNANTPPSDSMHLLDEGCSFRLKYDIQSISILSTPILRVQDSVQKKTLGVVKVPLSRGPSKTL